MRASPEVLVFELFRELAYGDSRSRNAEIKRAQEFSDSIKNGSMSTSEHLLLNTCRGRTKTSKAQRGEFFYAPPYLGLTKYAWFRQSSDRTIRDYFLGGPVAHKHHLTDQDRDLIIEALYGDRSASVEGRVQHKEILSLLALEELDNPSKESVISNLVDSVTNCASAPLEREQHPDPLADTLYSDFLEVCTLEAKLPRREWLFFLSAFLRIAVTMWLLAHLRITTMVRDWVLDALRQEILPREEDVIAKIQRRYEGLLHPTSTPTHEAYAHVEDYMRARVELRILIRKVKEMNPQRFLTANGESKKLSLSQTGSSRITLVELLTIIRNSDWSNVVGSHSLDQWLIRDAEQYRAWRSPRNSGQGKNIDELIRVLYRSAEDDSGSGLLITESKATTRIVPGHRLLQLFAHLAARSRLRLQSQRDGKLVLQHIEQHLYDYGIDFRASSFGRPLLIHKLVEGGFLVGSPDAGESAEVIDTLGEASVEE